MTTPEDILQDLENTLTPLIEDEGGVLDIATSLDHALEILATAPKRWRVVLLYEGYGDVGQGRFGVNSVRIATFIHANLGLAKEPGRRIYKTSGNDTMSMLARIELVSYWMRALRWANTNNVDCEGFSMDDSSWVSDPPRNSTAHVINWSLEMALPNFSNYILIN